MHIYKAIVHYHDSPVQNEVSWIHIRALSLNSLHLIDSKVMRPQSSLVNIVAHRRVPRYEAAKVQILRELPLVLGKKTAA